MKKLVTLLAVLSFAVGLNANNLKEEIYNSNPSQFDKLVQTLNTIQKEQSEKLAQAYEQKQINKAIKTIFSNKEILKNFNSAVIKDGQIVKLSNAKDADGISFWHEHSSSLQDTPPANTCRVYDPSWDNISYDTPCGMLKYQMTSTSTYANADIRVVGTMLCPAADDVINTINAIDPNVALTTTTGLDPICIYDTLGYSLTKPMFTTFQLVEIIPAFAGYWYNYEFKTPNGIADVPLAHVNDTMNAYSFYPETSYTYDSNPISTLKSGNYIQILSITYRDSANNVYVILKWFNLRVENYYLGDVSVADHNQPAGVNIGFNNREITINLAENINPTNKVYELYDISGRMVDRQNLMGHQTTISMPNVSSGIYVIRVQGKGLSATQKIAFNK